MPSQRQPLRGSVGIGSNDMTTSSSTRHLAPTRPAPMRLRMAIALGALWSMLAVAGPATAAEVNLPKQQVEVCQMACGQALASCEREFGVKGQCTRKSQFCKDDCSKPQPEKSLSKAERKRQNCVQRCESSASLCATDRAEQREQCNRGKAACAARC